MCIIFLCIILSYVWRFVYLVYNFNNSYYKSTLYLLIG